MATRQELLRHLWNDVIANCRRDPDGPFAEAGRALERLLATGVSARDVCHVLRCVAYEAVFGTLFALSDPGVDENEDIGTLYEELLTADPSGMEGRPGATGPP